MDSKTTFCEECRDDVYYIEKESYIDSKLKGVNYNYYGKMAFCEKCNAEVFVSEITDYNLNQLYNEFRRVNNIISLEKILEIPQKYNIGKRPLSLLLGWGEQTFSRYCDGDMPTKQYSMILDKIYDEPSYYLELLENNKDTLKSKSTYEKSKEATDILIFEQPSLSDDKMDSVANYLLSECEDITPLALQKILYYIQGFYFAFTKKFIFKQNCEAWVHGPVFKEIYNKYKKYCYDPITGYDLKDEVSFSVTEKAIIDSVIKNFGCYSGKILESFTHAETPWLETRGDLPATMSSDKQINKDLISAYFIDVKEKNNMINPTDIFVYSTKMFEQNLSN
ncbi:MAG: DUF4065 domain-containing protein [Bacilli bacterium]